MKNLRILLLNASSIYGGGEYYVLQLAKQLKNRNHFVIVGCRDDSVLFHKCKDSQIPVEPVKFGKTGTKNLFKNIRKIRQIAGFNSINIVHTNTGIDRTAGAVSSHLARTKHITSCHSLVSIRRNITHYFRNKYLTDAIIADGESVKDLLVNMDRVSEGKIFVINNGISQFEIARNTLSGQAVRNEFNISPNDIVIGNTARFVQFKGHKYLLNAFAELSAKMKNIKLFLVGDGELMDELTAYARVLNISENVIFAGFRDDLQAVYSAMDIYVQPSLRGSHELLPFTVIYAMAQAIPVIASKVGEMPVMVEDGKTGFIIDERSPYSISEKAEKLISNPALRQMMGNEGNKKFLKEFTLEQMAGKTEKLYYEILNK